MSGSTRDLLNAAAGQLKKDGHHDYASAVESVLAPDGWKHLRDTSGQGVATPLSVTMDSELKSAIEDALSEFGWSKRALAEQAYEKVLAGEWLPEKVGRRRTRGKKAVWQVDVDASLRRRVQAELGRLTEEAGYRISEGGIIVAWVCEELGVDRGTGSAMVLQMPVQLRDHFAAARDRGVDLDALVDGRVRALVDGSWELPRPSKAPKGTWASDDWGKLSLRIDNSLRDALHEMAPRLSDELGIRVYPGTIVRQILTLELGQPAE
ncbi:hypothetical protein [Streptomyces violaceorubidus]|uniref:hypothetical protein n=1 Tax=Streptomyces violaceorubidus TaxID=284042 RepID=UPI0004BFFBE5|nr:hypothetical protein [Streptomyces violaceorubidus]